MTDRYLGCNISLKVGGGLGFYQGQVKTINPVNQSITLSKVVHNGKPTPTLEVTIMAEDILSLDVLSERADNTKPGPDLRKVKLETKGVITQKQESMVRKRDPQAFLASPKVNQISASKEVQAGYGFRPLHSMPQEFNQKINPNCSPSKQVPRRKPRQAVGEPYDQEYFMGSPRMNIMQQDFGQRKNMDNRTSNQKRNQQRRNQRDVTTFGSPLDEEEINTEFDFEKNLALFDKQAVREEIGNLNKPDVVKQADKKNGGNFRWDESVLEPKPRQARQIIVPPTCAGEIIYATDNGLLVPSISTEMRLNLMSTAVQHGLTNSRQLEMIGRAATEIILSVIGGSHRLEPDNSHQRPVVVLLCGAHMQGAAGVNCARQLEGHGVRTCVASPPSVASPSCISYMQEAKLYGLTKGNSTSQTDKFPQTVDLIVDARFDLDGQLGVSGHTWMSATNAWAAGSRAPVVALDPPSDTTPVVCPLATRMKLSPILPLAHFAEKGKVYLLNLNIPYQVYADCDIKYTTPFGAKMVIPLHSVE